jgi:amidase
MTERIAALLDGDLAGIAAAVRSEPALGRTLADEASRRIGVANGALNAVVATTDREPPAAPAGPLAGVPILLKDLQADAADLSLHRGSRVYRDTRPRGDSHLVARLRRAGASIIGRTNTPELGLNCVTEPALWGPARNPWGLDRTPGGSSGGAAAAVAAGLVPVAHSTDSGGSTRIPAAWCGVVGFKPTRGAVPAGPLRTDDWFGFSHEHAITRSVRDARTVFAVLGGAEVGEYLPFPVRVPVPPRPLRVGVVRDTPDGAGTHPDYRHALSEVERALALADFDVEELAPPDAARRIGPLFGGVVAAHLAAYAGRDAHLDWALLEPANAELLARGRGMSAADLVAMTAELRELATEIAAWMAGVDVVLSTTTAWPAPSVGAMPTDQPLRDLVAEIFRLAPLPVVFNVTGGPAMSVPWGRDRDGMPIGVHIAAHPGHDDTVLTTGEVVEALAPALPLPPRSET